VRQPELCRPHQEIPRRASDDLPRKAEAFRDAVRRQFEAALAAGHLMLAESQALA
jgi:hypothetical protein